MAETTIKLPRAPDALILDAFHEIARLVGAPHFSVQVAQHNDSVPADSENELSDSLRARNSALIEHCSVAVSQGGGSINFYRGGHAGEKSALYDEIRYQFQNNQQPLSFENRLAFLDVISKKLNPFDPTRTLPNATPEQAALLAIHSSTLERLEKLNEDMLRRTDEHRHRLDEEHTARLKELDARHQARADALALDAEKSRLGLQEREEALNKRIVEQDARGNTVVRRELRTKLLQEIKDRTLEFRLTPGTSKLRLPIHCVCIFAIALFVAGALFYADELRQLLGTTPIDTTALVLVSIKQLGFSVATAAMIVFYIRWLNSWFSQHASTEFKLRQFQLDFERASWIVETALEWKDTKGTTVPTELLEPISRGLFTSDGQEREPLHPADELASALMGSASKVRLKAGDSEVELDAKRIPKSTSRG